MDKKQEQSGEIRLSYGRHMKRFMLLRMLLVATFALLIPIAAGASTTWDWSKDAWIGSNQSLRKIRISTDRIALDNKKLSELLQSKKRQAKLNRNDLETVFSWSYAAWASQKPSMTLKQLTRLLDEPASALGNVVDNSYEYVRLRFLLETWILSPRDLLPLGRRLLKHNPNDLEVKFVVTKLLDPVDSLSERKQAIAYAQSLIRVKPRHAHYHALLGQVYFKMWLSNNSDKAAARNTAASYRRYLALSAPNARVRRDAAEIIALVEKTK